MENIRAYEVQVQGANTVKELKKEISDLRDKLVKLDNTSDDYKKTVDDLIKDEKKLKEVMSAGKNEINAAKGSYNALTQEMSALKKVWREVTSDSERNRIGTRISEINTELKKMDSEIGNFQRNVGNYAGSLAPQFMTTQQEIKALRTQLAGLKQGTDEYNSTFARLSELTVQQKKFQEQLIYSSADLGTMFSNLAGIAKGVVGGLSAINAAMGILGDSSDSVQEAMLRVQQFMAVVQGLEAIEGLGDKFSGFYDGINTFINSLFTSTSAVDAFSASANSAGGAASNAGAGLNANAGAANNLTQSTNQLVQATEALIDAEGRLTDAGIDVLINSQEEIESLGQEYVATHKLAKGKLELADSEGTLFSVSKSGVSIIDDATEAQKKQGAQNLNLIKSNKQLEAQLGGYNKMQVLSTAATKAQIKANNALIAGNTVQAVSWKAATVAINGFKVALVSTGIGAIVVALGSLVALLGEGATKLWDWVTGVQKWADAAKELESYNSSLNTTIEKANESIDYHTRLMEAQGESYDDVVRYKKIHIQALINEAKAQLDAQKAILATIPVVDRGKEKYKEFMEQLDALQKTYDSLNKSMKKVDQEAEIKKAQDATNARKKQEEQLKKSSEDRAKKAAEAYKKELAEAEKLYNETLDYFKTEKQKLDEKYKKEKALLEKYGKDTTALTKKYESEKTKIVLEEAKKRYLAQEDYNNRITALFEGTRDFFTESIEDAEGKLDMLKQYLEDNNLELKVIDPENFEYSIDVIEGMTDKSTATLKKFAQTVLGVSDDVAKNFTLSDLSLAFKEAEKSVKDANKALKEFDSQKAMDKASKAVSKYSTETQKSINGLMNEYGKMEAGQNAYSNNYIALMYKRWDTEDKVYAKTKEGIQQQIDEWQKIADDQNLTEEARYEAKQNITSLMMDLDNVEAEHTMEMLERKREALNTYLNTAKDTFSGVGSILGTVADAWETSIQAQLDAGEISEEEAEKEFEKVKSVQKAEALINSFSSAIGAYQSLASIPYVGPVLGAAAAAAALALGMAQVKAIDNTQIGSGGGGGSTNFVLPNVLETEPTIVQNVTSESDTDRLANALSDKPIRAYVVSSEITGAQEAERKRQNEATW